MLTNSHIIRIFYVFYFLLIADAPVNCCHMGHRRAKRVSTVNTFYWIYHDLVVSYNMAVSKLISDLMFDGLSRSIVSVSNTGFSFSLTYSTNT